MKKLKTADHVVSEVAQFLTDLLIEGTQFDCQGGCGASRGVLKMIKKNIAEQEEAITTLLRITTVARCPEQTE
jgi:hypothetical protein